VWLSERTVREHLHRLGLSRQALSAAPARAFGRFEAARPNEIWIGDVLHGPFVPCPRAPGSKRAKLFLLVDDYSRLLVHGRWVTEENPGPAKTCCARPSPAGAGPNFYMLIMPTSALCRLF
jgi:putative transposase